MIAKTDHELKSLRMAGHILAGVLRDLKAASTLGTSTAELDLMSEKLIKEAGAEPAFLGYKPDGAAYPYPATLCVSIDDEVVHGIPSEQRVLKNGDLVMLDLGLSYRGYFSDAAITFVVGETNEKTKRLIDATAEALSAALKVAKAGNRIGDIGAAIEAVAKKYGYGVVEELGGHGLGLVPHEGPYVPNVGNKGEGEKLVEGQVLAIEPIFTEGKPNIYLADDEWTYKTVDRSRSAEFEHTVLITKTGAEILTA